MAEIYTALMPYIDPETGRAEVAIHRDDLVLWRFYDLPQS